MPRTTLRIDFDQERAIGPGKIRLLELIDARGSISAAGREMDLINSLNKTFRGPVIASQVGGAKGGGAVLTPLGLAVVGHYRAIEAAASTVGVVHIAALAAFLAKPPPSGGPSKRVHPVSRVLPRAQGAQCGISRQLSDK
jgi:molybdate transport system regulatory protein